MREDPGATSRKVVVIGGGVVGASCLYHLAKAGWTDCVLFEKDELTSGSTWHAAGNCPNFSGSWSIMKMQNYSTDFYQRLGVEVDYPINYHLTGSIRRPTPGSVCWSSATSVPWRAIRASNLR